jgi:hypothetical protein
MLWNGREWSAHMLAWFAHEIDTQIADDLAPVTAIVTTPEMADFVFAHVLRPLWRDQ